MKTYSIRPAQFASILEGILEEKKEEVKRASKKDLKEVVELTAEELSVTSPVKTGKYAKGWEGKIIKDFDEMTVGRVRNRPRYRLTHLLEDGHGGPAPAPAYPHIEPAYEKGKRELDRRMR